MRYVVLWCVCFFVPVIVAVLFWLSERERKKADIRLQMKRRFNMSMFNAIANGMSYEQVSGLIRKTSELVSEKLLDNGVLRKTYIWNFGEYKEKTAVGISNGLSVLPGNDGGIAPTASITSGSLFDRAYIKAVFDDDKLVMKEQKGIGQIEDRGKG